MAIEALVLAVASAGGLCLVIEAMQVVISSRDADMTSVVLALAGSVLGAAPLVRSKSGDARQWIMPAVLIWTLVVVLKAWSPWRFAWPEPPFWKPEMVVPFWSYFDSRSVADLADVIGQALTFVPLGVLLAARSWRQSFLGVVLIGLVLATVLEIGQIFIPGRTSDISDVLSAAAGSGLGLASGGGESRPEPRPRASPGIGSTRGPDSSADRSILDRSVRRSDWLSALGFTTMPRASAHRQLMGLTGLALSKSGNPESGFG